MKHVEKHKLGCDVTRISSRLHLATRPKPLTSVHREIDVSNEKFVKPIIILVRFPQTAPGALSADASWMSKAWVWDLQTCPLMNRAA